MSDLYSRPAFLSTVSVDGNKEKDLLSFDLGQFKFKQFMKYTLTNDDVGRPDIIANRFMVIVNYGGGYAISLISLMCSAIWLPV